MLVFDTGNCLSGQPVADMSKGSAMAKSMDLMGCDAMALGSVDFGVGAESIRELSREVSFPFLSANISTRGSRGDSLFAKPYAILEVGSGETREKIAVIGITGQGEFGKLSREKTGDLALLDPLTTLDPVLREVRKETRRVILLSNMTREEDLAVANAFPEVDIIVGSQAPLFQMAAVYVKGGTSTSVGYEGKGLTGGTLIVSGLDKGRSLGTLEVTLDAEGGIEQFAYQIMAINPKIYEEDQELVSLLLTYENEMLRDDADKAVAEWSELMKGDYRHLRNLASVKARGEEAVQAYGKGDYKKAAEMLTTAKDSLLMREAAETVWQKFEEDLARGVPEGFKTSKVQRLVEEGKAFYRERRFADAKSRFAVASWELGKMRKIAEEHERYLREKDSFADDGFDMNMDEKSRAYFERALDGENLDDAFATLQRVNMKITQAQNGRKWRKVMDKIFGALGESARNNPGVAAVRARADSAYFKGAFPTARMEYNNLAKVLEPLVEKTGVFSGPPTPPAAQGDRYVGSDECQRCHEEEFRHWDATLHARAFVRMDESSRSDPSCVGCHVVGFGTEDGFKASEPDSGLAAVGCESCHGRGYLHTVSGDTLTLSPGYAKEMCATCHNPEEGFDLDYFPFLVRVMHK